MDRSAGLQPGDKPPEVILSDQPEHGHPRDTPPHLVVDESNDAISPKNPLDAITFKPAENIARTFTIDETKTVKVGRSSGTNVIVTSPKDAAGKMFFDAEQELLPVPESAEDDKVDITQIGRAHV